MESKRFWPDLLAKGLYETPYVLRADFAYRADRLIPGVQLTYAVLSTSPWRGLSALELLIRSQLRLRVYSE